MPLRAFAASVLAATALSLGPVDAASAQSDAPAAGALPSFRDTRRLVPGAPSAAPPARPAASTASAPEPSTAPASTADPAASLAPSPSPPPAAVPVPALPPGLRHLAETACGIPHISSRALPAGRMAILIQSSCRAGETVGWRYGGAAIPAVLDDQGYLRLDFDAFSGAEAVVAIAFADGTEAELPVAAEGLDSTTKVALVWRGEADLELHAFERAAASGEPGHVWPGARSSLSDAEARVAAGPAGAGFLAALGTGGTAEGAAAQDRVEVYTYLHRLGEPPGLVALAVARAVATEAAGRAPACPEAATAEVPFRLVVLPPGKPPAVTEAVVAAADCAVPLPAAVRLDHVLLPALRIGQR